MNKSSSNALAFSIALTLAGTGTLVAQQPKAPPSGRLPILGRTPGSTPAPIGRGADAPTATAGTPPATKQDRQVFKSGEVLPEPASPDEIGKPTITLPEEPIEPYLLHKNNGPFMVLAHTFQGPDATKYALALCKELRSKGFPAYVFWLRIQPGHSNIRGVPPTAPDVIQGGENVVAPERYRVHDEAAVLVGDCKSIDESEKVLYQVKHTHSDVLDGLPSIWKIRRTKGLARAILTTNPMVAAQELYPHQGEGERIAVAPGQAVDPSVLTAGLVTTKKADPLVKRMNSGPRSVYQCPGAYTLQVAEFVGRSSFDLNDPLLTNPNLIKQGPLAKAADDAEHLAESLTKCKSLDPRFRPYVYHDRTSSRVFLGSFSGPNDPALAQLRGQLDKISNELVLGKHTMLPLAPATELTVTPRP